MYACMYDVCMYGLSGIYCRFMNCRLEAAWFLGDSLSKPSIARSMIPKLLFGMDLED